MVADELQPVELQNEFDHSGFGTGALPRPADWRDFQMALAPGIAPCVGQTPPADDHLIPFIKGVYNQGAVPSCVAHSSAGMQSINEQMERSQWIEMDALRCYRDNGGNGSNGVATQGVLSYMQSQGMPALNGGRYKLASYAFANPMQPGGVDALKAAIFTGHPCVLAMLLPMDFMSGMSAGLGAVNRSAYHQVCLVGYTPDRVIYLNSWGSAYGNNGLGSVPWAYLQRPEQQGYVYAYTEIDSPDDDVTPPVELTISGYLTPPAGQVPSYKGGQLLSIVGTGFDAGVIQVKTTAGDIIAVEDKSATLLKCRLPRAAGSGQAVAMVVQREAVSVTGPLFVLLPANGPDPPPPVPVPPPPPPVPVGDLLVTVDATPTKGQPGWWKVIATARNHSGALVAVDWSGTIGGTPLTFYASQQAAIWNPVKTDTGTRLVVTGNAPDGRSATVTKELK